MVGRLIINVDDYGFTEGINHAVWRLAELGTISATNLMMNMPFVETAVDLASAFPDLSIGIHINLTQGKPILSPEKLTTMVDDDGNFLSMNTLRKQRRSISVSEVYAEVEAQVSTAYTLLGTRIDHWNSHQGIHRFQPFYKVATQVCRDYQIPAMRSHRHFFAEKCNESLRLHHPSFASVRKFGMKRIMTEAYYDWLKMLSGSMFAMPKGLIIVQDNNPLVAFEWAVECVLPPGLWEIPCHPAVTIAGLSQTTLIEARLEEFQFLSSESFVSAVKKLPGKLVGFSEITRSSGRTKNG